MNKKILFLVLLGVILVPTSCFAVISNDLPTLIDNLAQQLGLMAGSLSIIAFIVAGIMFLTATGNPSRMTIAKGALIAAVIGIIILALSGTAKDFVENLFNTTGAG
ncbi:MAG: hypothetical protein A2401_02990 [Candidatus Staskawiczbacteria bacterium RIFOXYC1_FULL_38_18]|uniref:Conjugal transfer protein TrbC n=1 Tax=Candidatus Staskawiczbacteria bacterium RIFOXYC1_FULL_38_18 TaxID=1802229 RepID=A0A1G2JDE6_9BACT|nr:MAG: hypothetical protein A2401_02990 [Candidatus Staskawiczbacteria bacterium RIFOXYC1_FULL_38_18]